MMLMCPAQTVFATTNARTSGASLSGVRRMNPEQNNPGLFQWTSTLNSDLPKVFVKRQYDAGFGFRQIQQDGVRCARVIHASPQDIVALGSKRLNNRLRKVLVGEEEHLRRNWEGLIFVGQITGVRQTSEDVLPRQARVVRENVVLRLARCQEFQNELNGETRAADHRLACQDLRVNDDVLRQRHTNSLLCQIRFDRSREPAWFANGASKLRNRPAQLASLGRTKTFSVLYNDPFVCEILASRREVHSLAIGAPLSACACNETVLNVSIHGEPRSGFNNLQENRLSLHELVPTPLSRAAEQWIRHLDLGSPQP